MVNSRASREVSADDTYSGVCKRRNKLTDAVGFEYLTDVGKYEYFAVTVLNACIDTPEPVHVQIGLKEITQAGENLALISARYMSHDQVQGSLGVLGSTRMHYERAMTAVAYVAQLFSETLNKI